MTIFDDTTTANKLLTSEETMEATDEENNSSSLNMDVENEKEKENDEMGNGTPADSTTNDDDRPTMRWWKFGGVSQAQGLCALGAGRGALVMSNIFLASSFIYLASDEAGCVNEEDEIIDDCDNKVYGFTPASLVANIAVISGILSACFMPIAGAMIDYTEYRKVTGIWSATLMLIIQAVQIGTVASTWFVMLILQAISGFIYQVQVLAVYAYFPELSRLAGEEKMTNYSSIFTSVQFLSQALFLLTIIVVSMLLGIGDDSVRTAQLGQAVNVVWSAVFFWLGWKLVPHAKASRAKPIGKNLIQLGFSQIYHTARHINQYYPIGLRWYLLCLVFAEAGVNAFTTLAVVYMSDHLNMSGSEIGIVFLLTLLFALPGTKLGAMITHFTDPKRSWSLCMLCLIVVSAGGAFLVDVLPNYTVYVWGSFIGVLFGWFYPTENLFFSMIVPRGQEAELSGFFVYCTQILGWLPPLIFATLVELDVSQTYGVMTLAVFFFIAIVILAQSGVWEDIVAESKVRHDMVVESATNSL